MSQRLINIGTGPNTKDGDSVRQAFNLTNQNFTEIYTLLGQNEGGNLDADLKGSLYGDDSTLIVDGTNGKIYATDLTANNVSTTHLNAVSANIIEYVTTAELVTNVVTLPNGVYTRTTAGAVPANTPTVIWSSFNTDITSAKLVIQAEGTVSPDVNGSATWHTQVCEAHVVKRVNFTTAPSLSVYGITYTSASALVTFTTQFNVITNKMEILATATNAGYPLTVKIFATEIETSD